MDIARAKQIMNSPQNIPVTFEGDEIWIDEIQEDQGTVSIHALTTGRASRIPVDRLHEQ